MRDPLLLRVIGCDSCKQQATPTSQHQQQASKQANNWPGCSLVRVPRCLHFKLTIKWRLNSVAGLLLLLNLHSAYTAGPKKIPNTHLNKKPKKHKKHVFFCLFVTPPAPLHRLHHSARSLHQSSSSSSSSYF